MGFSKINKHNDNNIVPILVLPLIFSAKCLVLIHGLVQYRIYGTLYVLFLQVCLVQCETLRSVYWDPVECPASPRDLLCRE